MLKGIVNGFHQLVERHVVSWRPSPVVGNLDHARLVVFFACERADLNVVGRVDTIGFSKRLWSVFLAVDRKLFWHFAEVGIQNALYRFGTSRRDLFVAILDDGTGYRADDFVHLGMHVAVLANDFAAIVSFRHHAVFVDHIEHIAYLTALTEGVVAVHSDELGHLFCPGIADDKHLREVKLFAIDTHDLCLDESDAGKAPAGARAALVVDGRMLHVDRFSDLVDRFFVGFLGEEGAAYAQQ